MLRYLAVSIGNLIIEGAINYPGYDPVKAEKMLTSGAGGPYELLSSILLVCAVLGVLGTLFVKKDKVRLAFGFFTAVDAVAAMIVYSINQMSYGGPILSTLILLLLVALAYGIVFVILLFKHEKKMKALEAQALAAAANAPDKRPGGCRFDD